MRLHWWQQQAPDNHNRHPTTTKGEAPTQQRHMEHWLGPLLL